MILGISIGPQFQQPLQTNHQIRQQRFKRFFIGHDLRAIKQIVDRLQLAAEHPHRTFEPPRDLSLQRSSFRLKLLYGAEIIENQMQIGSDAVEPIVEGRPMNFFSQFFLTA